MRMVLIVVAAFVLLVSFPLSSVRAEQANPGAAASPPTSDAKCEHGVVERLCTRCNPKLAAVYKAKGDWCAEHSRPESQCVLCHPELAKKGIK